MFRVTETVPVPAGQSDLILQLPEWIPGEHGPKGDMNLIADVHFMAGGKELTWIAIRWKPSPSTSPCRQARAK